MINIEKNLLSTSTLIYEDKISLDEQLKINATYYDMNKKEEEMENDRLSHLVRINDTTYSNKKVAEECILKKKIENDSMIKKEREDGKGHRIFYLRELMKKMDTVEKFENKKNQECYLAEFMEEIKTCHLGDVMPDIRNDDIMERERREKEHEKTMQNKYSKYLDKLKLLRDIGFKSIDDHQILFLLDSYKGNVNIVSRILTAM